MEVYKIDIKINDSDFQLIIHDVGGNSATEKIATFRKNLFSITNIDVVIMCFSLVDPDSLYNLKTKVIFFNFQTYMYYLLNFFIVVQRNKRSVFIQTYNTGRHQKR